MRLTDSSIAESKFVHRGDLRVFSDGSFQKVLDAFLDRHVQNVVDGCSTYPHPERFTVAVCVYSAGSFKAPVIGRANRVCTALNDDNRVANIA